MAITKIHSINGRTLDSLIYIMDEKKTDDGNLVSGFACEPMFAELEFNMVRKESKMKRGDFSAVGGNNINGYHLIQSFSPRDNITPTKAHEIGKQLATDFLGGKYQYVIATHIDKGHIHNHFIINSTSYVDLKKLHTVPYKTVQQIRDISDQICIENDLSVIEKPDLTHKSRKRKTGYKEYAVRLKGESWKAKLENKIREALYLSETLEDFKNQLFDNGVEVKFGKNNSYASYKLIEHDGNFCGFSRLGDGKEFSKDNIISQLETGQTIEQRRESELILPIDKNLILEEKDDYYIINIPNINNSQQAILYKKDVIENRENEFIVQLYSELKYQINCSNGKRFMIAGLNFYQYFNNVNEYFYSIKDYSKDSKIAFSGVEGGEVAGIIIYKSRKESLKRVKEMANVLLEICNDEIYNYKDFQKRIDECNVIKSDILKQLKEHEKIISYYNDILINLEIYKDLKEKYLNNTVTEFEKNAFKNAQSKIEFLAGIGDISPSEIKNILENERIRYSSLETFNQKNEEKLSRLSKNCEFINEIINNDFDKNNLKKKEKNFEIYENEKLQKGNKSSDLLWGI